MKGIIFAGCSFTWGQGLYFYSNLPNLYYPNNFECEINKITQSHINFMKTKRFARLVANHFDTFEVTKFCNGGSDDDSLLFLDMIFDKDYKTWEGISNEKYTYEDFDCCILQLTHPLRSPFYYTLNGIERKTSINPDNVRYDFDNYEYLEEWILRNNYTFDNVYELLKKQLSERIKEKLMFLESKGIKCYILIWINDHLENVKKDEWLNQRIIKLNYSGETFNTIEDIMDKHDSLKIYKDYENFQNPPKDKHPSLLCHKIIANNIIEQIKNKNHE